MRPVFIESSSSNVLQVFSQSNALTAVVVQCSYSSSDITIRSQAAQWSSRAPCGACKPWQTTWDLWTTLRSTKCSCRISSGDWLPAAAAAAAATRCHHRHPPPSVGRHRHKKVICIPSWLHFTDLQGAQRAGGDGSHYRRRLCSPGKAVGLALGRGGPAACLPAIRRCCAPTVSTRSQAAGFF